MLGIKPVHLLSLLVIMTVSLNSSCQKETLSNKGSFGYDVDFLQQYQSLVILQAADNPKAQIAVVPQYQGRVMTSTSNANEGTSYGWINYDLIESKQHVPHMNAFGGEDRLWLSPEGGQYSVYFQQGNVFDYENWQTPPVIDTDAYEIVAQSEASVSFHKKASLVNYLGTPLDFDIDRTITIFTTAQIQQNLGIEDLSALQVVGYESVNTLTNTGTAWSTEKGLLGIWILGMFQPTPKTTIIVPYTLANSDTLHLTDNYFGTIPTDRLRVTPSAILLKADGKYRSKIGLSAVSALPIAGSYDAGKGILTIVQYDLDASQKYMKSTWQLHDNPFDGDALNAYNDGPLEDGTQMGPFYELESSSPGIALQTNESLKHTHRTYHFEGSPAVLTKLSKQLLGIALEDL